MSGQLLVKHLSGLYLGEELSQTSGIISAIANKYSSSTLTVNVETVSGDAQADPKHHGGLDRVLHHFPREHYGQYRRWDMMNGFKDAPSMGENISTVGLDETLVNIGDIITIGEVELQVTQPRSPCFKLNQQFGHKEFALAMQTRGLCGWFYRVIKPGVIQQNDSLYLIERRTDMSVRDAMAIYFSPEFDAKAYDRLASCEGLANAWVNSVQRRLDNQKIEDWQMRLFGPEGI
ncbi:MOSC domain-containing protein [Shewanella sp. D64]|uniref:MOSC domain-containing protein n=1 Tax=unclassified Shewanella TaxID=196818 RepID=UPI0022BA5773|nr:MULTISPECIES: MOSC domain-containing protein [unclassified Shewanella]MEC4726251.1 MOSC domain-containing protein [Shewanella sp. D64]MEC4738263.1 MOSC domain-containing protein [Shewanella sp. E94]WBJ95401.1 MOSC domain-containing protein [Shewanella sp. MTB7]